MYKKSSKLRRDGPPLATPRPRLSAVCARTGQIYMQKFCQEKSKARTRRWSWQDFAHQLRPYPWTRPRTRSGRLAQDFRLHLSPRSAPAPQVLSDAAFCYHPAHVRMLRLFKWRRGRPYRQRIARTENTFARNSGANQHPKKQLASASAWQLPVFFFKDQSRKNKIQSAQP